LLLRWYRWKLQTAKRSNFARETTTNWVHFQWFTNQWNYTSSSTYFKMLSLLFVFVFDNTILVVLRSCFDVANIALEKLSERKRHPIFSNVILEELLYSILCKWRRKRPSVLEAFWREINRPYRYARKYAIKLRSCATLKNKAAQRLVAVVNFEINSAIKRENSQYPTPILDRNRHVNQGLDSIITNRSR